jgi:hypothetical protein
MDARQRCISLGSAAHGGAARPGPPRHREIAGKRRLTPEAGHGTDHRPPRCETHPLRDAVMHAVRVDG